MLFYLIVAFVGSDEMPSTSMEKVAIPYISARLFLAKGSLRYFTAGSPHPIQQLAERLK